MSQLRHFNCPCIDVGTVLNCYAQPSRFFERPYMAQDSIHDVMKMPFVYEGLREKYLAFCETSSTEGVGEENS